MPHTDVLSFVLEELLDLVTGLAIWDLDIVLGSTSVVVHEGEEVIISDIEL